MTITTAKGRKGVWGGRERKRREGEGQLETTETHKSHRKATVLIVNMDYFPLCINIYISLI